MMNRESQRFGWVSLTVWVLLGVALEAAHAFKISAYLDDTMTRLLWTLAHAHGVGLAIVVLVHGVAGGDAPRWTGTALRSAAVLIPLGFALGTIAHPESDPSIGIVLVPIGAAALVAALARTAWAATREQP